MKNPKVVRSVGRVPISHGNIEQDRDEDEEEDDDEQEADKDKPSQLQDRDGSKRRRSDSLESVDTLRECKVARHTAHSLRPKASDFDDMTKECLVVAIAVYRCLISSSNPFPEHAAETNLAREAWIIACDDLECDLPLGPKVAKLVCLLFICILIHVYLMFNRLPTVHPTFVGSSRPRPVPSSRRTMTLKPAPTKKSLTKTDVSLKISKRGMDMHTR